MRFRRRINVTHGQNPVELNDMSSDNGAQILVDLEEFCGKFYNAVIWAFESPFLRFDKLDAVIERVEPGLDHCHVGCRLKVRHVQILRRAEGKEPTSKMLPMGQMVQVYCDLGCERNLTPCVED